MKNNTGLEYFPMSTDFFDSDKISLIEAEFGIKGSYAAIRLLSRIYKFDGYYCNWDRDHCMIFAKLLGEGFTSGMVDEIVKSLIRRGVFDRSMYEKFGVLTSRGIQHRFFEACRRRRIVNVNHEYLLDDISEFTNVRTFGMKHVSTQPVPSSSPLQVTDRQEERKREPSCTDEDTEMQIIENFFFERNFIAPQMQYRRLVNYNMTSRRNWSGMPHANRIAAAAMWNQRTADDKPDERMRFTPKFLSVWKRIYLLAKDVMKSGIPLLRDLLDDRLKYTPRCISNGPHMEDDDELVCPASVERFLHDNSDSVLPILIELIGNRTLNIKSIHERSE